MSSWRHAARAAVAHAGVALCRAILRRGLQSQSRPGGVVIEGAATVDDEVTFGGSNNVGMFTFVSGDVSIGFGTTIGAQCVLVGPVAVGDFCQVAPHVLIFGGDHPLDRFSTYTGKRLLNRALNQYMKRSQVNVGHGVWIGCNAVLLRGVTVGNGSVVAAGAVVSSDVPPYSIVAGSPAGVVATRMDPDLADLVEQTRWWTLRDEEQEVLRDLAHIDFRAAPDAARAELRRVIEALEARARAA